MLQPIEWTAENTGYVPASKTARVVVENQLWDLLITSQVLADKLADGGKKPDDGQSHTLVLLGGIASLAFQASSALLTAYLATTGEEYRDYLNRQVDRSLCKKESKR